MVQVKHDMIWTRKEEVGIKKYECIQVTTLNAGVTFKSRCCTHSIRYVCLKIRRGFLWLKHKFGRRGIVQYFSHREE